MASTYLTRTFGSSGNQKTFTISFWFKRSNLTTGHFFTYQDASSEIRSDFSIVNDRIGINFNPTGSAWGADLTIRDNGSNILFRDTNSWYHLVMAFDTTQATEANRIKVYVNGVQKTMSAYPSRNFDTGYSTAIQHGIGTYAHSPGGNYFDGLMSHFHFIDGTAYDASAFGSTDSTTGEWKINTSPSVTYGTNGFFILKDGNSVTDVSPNTNNFTVAGGTLTKTEDCPSNVFATFNSLASKVLGTVGFTLENGNTVLNPSSNTAQFTTSTLCTPSTGKFYWEMKSTSSSGTDWPDIGFMFTDSISTHMSVSNNPQHNFSYASAIEPNGTKWQFGTQTTSWFGGFNSNDIINCAVDVSAGKFWWGVNGSWLNSGDPANGTNAGATFAAGTSITAWTEQYSVGDVQANFGNGYFGTTAVSSAGTNASGNGIFEYDVPTGFTALSTKGLNL